MAKNTDHWNSSKREVDRGVKIDWEKKNKESSKVVPAEEWTGLEAVECYSYLCLVQLLSTFFSYVERASIKRGWFSETRTRPPVKSARIIRENVPYNRNKIVAYLNHRNSRFIRTRNVIHKCSHSHAGVSWQKYSKIVHAMPTACLRETK